MVKIRIGVQLHPQATSVQSLNTAAHRVDASGVDTLFTWDHFFPLYGDTNATHFECYTLMAAWAALTKNVEIGALVTCNSYRNANLLADMARTIDHISNGRFILGIGAGWFERDYSEYGFEFGTAPTRLAALRAALPVIETRLARLNPAPLRKMPLMIGGGGEKVTLRLTAQHATIWNFIGTPEEFKRKSAILDDWCTKLGRNPAEIERSVLLMGPASTEAWDAYVAVGASHLIVALSDPWDMAPVDKLVAWRARL